MNRKFFGTDGVRGIANKDLTGELAYRIGRALTYVLTKGKEEPHIVIGKDTRISGDMLEAALVAGICSVGANVYLLGVVPTPAVSILTKLHHGDAGIVISASHNPVEYNGIKIFDGHGFKLSDEIEMEIEKFIFDEDIDCYPIGEKIGKSIYIKNSVKEYMAYLEGTFEGDFEGLRVAVDCGNGAAYFAAPTLLSKHKAQVEVIHATPNGLNINVNCGSTHPEMVQKRVLETGADIGLSFDGDADRLIAVDEKGNIVDGDKIMTICANHLKLEGKLKNNTVVSTVMSNLGMDICFRENNIHLIKTQVGDRYVIEEMIKGGHSIGGEQSGHIIFLDYNTTGDGLLTAVQLLSIMRKTKKPLSYLAAAMTTLPQVLVNAKINKDKREVYQTDEAIQKKIAEVEKKLNNEGRILIRASGTEPLIRVMIEGKDYDYIEQAAIQIASLIEAKSK